MNALNVFICEYVCTIDKFFFFAKLTSTNNFTHTYIPYIKYFLCTYVHVCMYKCKYLCIQTINCEMKKKLEAHVRRMIKIA